jgi:integrase
VLVSRGDRHGHRQHPARRGLWEDEKARRRDLPDQTAATILDDAAPSARLIADQLGHARPSRTQDVYMGRGAVDRKAALVSEAGP